MSAAKVRASFGRAPRKVLKTRKPVLVETHEGQAPIAPVDSAGRKVSHRPRARDYVPNETTALAVNEPISQLTRYRTVAEALDSLKPDARRRPKKPVSA